jgi:predicted O-methyltransferase YrrM
MKPLRWLRKSNPPDQPNHYQKNDVETDKIVEQIDEPFRSALRSMYRCEPQSGTDGQMHQLDGNTLIAPRQGMVMYDLYLQAKPRASLEIGMAYGFSTVFFAAALKKCGGDGSSHTSIDPFQNSLWHGIALERLRAVGSKINFIEKTGTRALAELQDRSFDYLFIDGNHRFDDVLTDFTNYAPFVNPSGLVLLDDMWMPSVKAVVAFVEGNREDFERLPSGHPNLALFRRIGTDQRSWDHFKPFATS